MKNIIYGLCQNMIIILELDSTDIVIYRYLIDFYNTYKMKTKRINGKEYFWMLHRKIVKDLPFLNINKKTIGARLNKLASKGILEAYVYRGETGTYCYYHLIENVYEKLVCAGLKNKYKKLQGKRINNEYEDEQGDIDAEEGGALEPPPVSSGTGTIDSKLNNSQLGIKISKDILGDSEESPKNTVDVVIDENNFISYWNSFDNVRKHFNTNTKIYRDTIKIFNHLKKGTFFKNCELNDSFLKKHNIKKELLIKKWNDTEIERGLEKLSLLFKNGYWPSEKDILPKNLKELIYNPRTGFSYFLKVCSNTPKPLIKEIEIIPKDEQCYDMCYKYFFEGKEPSDADKKELVYKFNDMWKVVHNMYAWLGRVYQHTSFRSYFGNEHKPYLFFEQYLSWLRRKDKRNIYALSNKSYEWIGFVSFVEKEHGYILFPDEKKRAKLRRDHIWSVKEFNRMKSPRMSESELAYECM